MEELKGGLPNDVAKILCERLLATVDLDGYYQIDYYTGELTVCGIYLPNGRCACNKYNQTLNEYEQFDLPFDCFSEYSQTMILLEVAKIN